VPATAALAVMASAILVYQPVYAAALVLGACLLIVLATNVHVLPVFLILTMFVESLALGPGLRIGRLAGGIALAVIACYLIARGSAGLRPNALLTTAATFGVWMIASSYWASEQGPVFRNLFSYSLGIAYLLTFAVLIRTERQLVAVFSTLAFASFIFGIVAFATYASSHGAVSAAETARGSGLQGDPNYFATYQVIALPAALALAVWERRPQWRAAYYGIVAVILVSVVSSLSRGGLVALSVVVAATVLLPRRAFFRRAGQKVNYLVAMLAAAGVAVLVGSAAFVSRVQSILNPSQQQGFRGSGRLDLWSAAWHGFRDHAWFGVGSGNFAVHALDLLQSTPGVDTTQHYVSAGREVHNAYLETLVELGPLGAALFALLIGLSIWYLVRAARRARRQGRATLERFAIALAVSVLGYAISAIFLSIELAKAVFILAGLALALDVMTREAGGLGSNQSLTTEEPTPR
jgi:O-antigen ligase